jgi:hypothetical protein
MPLSASFGLAGCAAIEELRETFLRWVEAEKLPTGRGVAADDLPDANPVITPEKPPQKEAGKPPKKRVKSVSRSQGPQTVVLPSKIPNSTETVRPEGTERQGESSSPWPRSMWRPPGAEGSSLGSRPCGVVCNAHGRSTSIVISALLMSFRSTRQVSSPLGHLNFKVYPGPPSHS